MYLGGDESLTSLKWLKDNVLEGHGALGRLYPQKTWTSPNRNIAVNNGLSCPDHPEYGSWGGRYQMTKGGYFTDAIDDYVANMLNAAGA